MSSSWAQMSDQAVRRHNEGVLSSSEKGDLLEFPRVGISHWAVYVGDGRVIHRTGNKDNGGRKDEKAEIREDSFWDVVGNSLAKINNYLDKKRVALPGQEIVKRARKKVGEVGYDLLWKNCEHFATWCRYGEEFSRQAMIGAAVAVAIIAYPLLIIPVGIGLIGMGIKRKIDNKSS